MSDSHLTFTALQSEQPFDAVAEQYDTQFARSRLGCWLREAVHRHLAGLVQPGERVLEMGCGTGEDALWLARRGVRLVATDASAAMLAVAYRKAVATKMTNQIRFVQVDLAELGRVESSEWGVESDAKAGAASASPSASEPYAPYDAVLANFGVLNCLPDRRPLAAQLARLVRPGGRLALVVMSPICPWEIAWYTAHGQIRPALRRFRSGAEAQLGHGATVQVWYPTPRRLRAEFAPAFRLVHAAGVGVLLPPSYLSYLVDGWPRFFTRVAAWDWYLSGRFPWTWLADHYLMIFERRQGSLVTEVAYG